jgi:hypothetical protein
VRRAVFTLREIASLYSITDNDERRHTLGHLLDDNIYMMRAVDRSLPVDVRFPHLSSGGLCLANSVLSQRSPSSQSVASIPVCYLSCHVFAIANRHFSQPSSFPDPAATLLCRRGG